MGQNYRFNRLELAGSLGDLGTLLPLAIGMILINGLKPTGLFLTIGIFYILSGIYFGVTVPVPKTNWKSRVTCPASSPSNGRIEMLTRPLRIIEVAPLDRTSTLFGVSPTRLPSSPRRISERRDATIS